MFCLKDLKLSRFKENLLSTEGLPQDKANQWEAGRVVRKQAMTPQVLFITNSKLGERAEENK